MLEEGGNDNDATCAFIDHLAFADAKNQHHYHRQQHMNISNHDNNLCITTNLGEHGVHGVLPVFRFHLRVVDHVQAVRAEFVAKEKVQKKDLGDHVREIKDFGQKVPGKRGGKCYIYYIRKMTDITISLL